MRPMTTGCRVPSANLHRSAYPYVVVGCDLCVYPFESLLDWNTFAIFIPEKEMFLGKNDELSSRGGRDGGGGESLTVSWIFEHFSGEELEEMQRNVLRVRKHFLWKKRSKEERRIAYVCGGIGSDKDMTDLLVDELEYRGRAFGESRRWLELNGNLQNPKF